MSVVRPGLALLTILAVTGCATNPGPITSKPGTTYGKIYVDTPEVYTRERLVNDRFQQDAWLREKLREVPTQGLQGGIGISSQTSTSLSLAVGETPESAPKEELEKADPLKEIEDAPVEQFRDAMAYREEVRNEILENQLDDRHDIAGNTLYRLKFDTTIVPLHDTSAYAMVEVTIKGSSFWDVSGETAQIRVPSDVQVNGIPLPDYDFAEYVTGLDSATISFYDGVFNNWVRDIDPSKYSKEEILYGSLQAYFDFHEVSNEIVGKTNCMGYSSKAQMQAALNELGNRNVPREYLDAGGLSEESEYVDESGEKIREVATFQEICVKSGLANFIANMRDHDNVIYTYAVTPKERVQRIYGNTLAADALGVSLGAKQESVGAALAHSSAREARANAIMRQPQIVGYSPKAHHSSEATMGWLVGPRYRISSDPNGQVSFRHVPAQHTLTGIVSVPSWLSELTLVTRTYWLDENGVEFSQEGNELTADLAAMNGNEVKITLPADLTSIDTILDPKRRQPQVKEPTAEEKKQELRACKKGTVVIRGGELWRSTVVTLGGQQADLISVLPNMKGIVATFNLVEPSISGSEALYLWTSEGEEFVRTITINDDCKKSPSY